MTHHQQPRNTESPIYYQRCQRTCHEGCAWLRKVIQELTLTKLIQQNERLIHLVQELLDKQPQTASRPPLPLHRPWNVTPSTPTRPPHSVSVPASSTIYFTNNPGNKWQHYTRNSTKSAPSIFSSTRLQPLFVDLDNKFQHIPAQHRISGSTRVAEFNSFAGPGNFAKHLTELLFQSFLLKSISVGFILTMVTRGTTKINWIHHVFSLWKSMPHTYSQK